MHSRKPQDFHNWFQFLRGAAEVTTKQSVHGSEEDSVDCFVDSTASNTSLSGASPESSPPLNRSTRQSARPSYGEQGARLLQALLSRVMQLPKVYGMVEDGADLERGHERMVQLLAVCPFAVVKVSVESAEVVCTSERRADLYPR